MSPSPLPSCRSRARRAALACGLAFIVGCTGGSDPPAQPSAKKKSSSNAEASAVAPDTVNGADVKPARYEFAGDGVGAMLVQTLSPPRTVPVEPLSFTATAAARPTPRPETVLTSRLWPLAPAGVARSPVRLRAFPGPVPRVAAALDVPTVAGLSLTAVPVQPVMAAGPLTYVAAPAGDRPLTPPASRPPTEGRPAVQDDPTRAAALGVLLRPIEPGRTPPAPPEPATPLDPLNQRRAVQLNPAPPDRDAPAAAPGIPVLPTFAAPAK